MNDNNYDRIRDSKTIRHKRWVLACWHIRQPIHPSFCPPVDRLMRNNGNAYDVFENIDRESFL